MFYECRLQFSAIQSKIPRSFKEHLFKCMVINAELNLKLLFV